MRTSFSLARSFGALTFVSTSLLACGSGDGAKATDAGGAAQGGSSSGGALGSGAKPTGGTSAGGQSASGAAWNGAAPSGGRSTGGTPAGGMSTAGSGTSSEESGGANSTPGSCAGSCESAPTGSCSSPQVRITSVTLDGKLNYSTDEINVVPLAIAAKPGGGSRIAWMTGYSHYGSSTASKVHVAELDCDDKLVGTPFTFEAYDFQDLAADAEGGVVMVTRDAQGSGDPHCGDVQNLCFLPSDRPGCYDTYLVRHDCAGAEQWATKLTSSSASNAPYAISGNDTYVWWYQHHGRLAYDGENYAAYFADATNAINENSGDTCGSGSGQKVDIHEADRMQVVGPSGEVLKGHDSFGGGCSHSWTTRLVWDPRTKHFVMVCATDNDCRIAQPPFPLRTIASGTCDGTLFGGDVVNAGDAGYWTAWSQGGTVRLEHFSTGASDKTIADAGNAQNPHLVSFGKDKMLLAWRASASAVAAQVYDSTSGEAVGEPLSIAVPDHPWQSWKSFPDGSVAYAAVGTASSTIQIARVMPCAD